MRLYSIPWILLLVHLLSLSASAAPASARMHAQTSGPIGRVARLFSPQLVEVENRIDWLRGRLVTLAPFAPKPLRSAHGWRSKQTDDSAESPTLTLDLRGVYLLSDIFVIPSHAQPGDLSALFPLRLKLETSINADFTESTVVYATPDGEQEEQRGYPLRVQARDLDARFVRLTVEQGHLRVDHQLSAISELLVFSGGEPVSFNAAATSTHSMNMDGAWSEAYAIDGRSPLGVWEAGVWSNSRGDLFEVPADDPAADWVVELDQQRPIDRIVLFPYMLPELAGPGILPKNVEVRIDGEPLESPALAIGTGGESSSPLVIPMGGITAGTITLHSSQSIGIGERNLHAMSEIEVWSLGRNVAHGREITIRAAGEERLASPELTDGKGNGHAIFPLDRWLQQIDERFRLQDEQQSLDPVRANLVTESELNATWGASLAIGLCLLLPVAIVERRRLVSKKQVDQLRKRIASDLHDDIGSNLGSISLIARSAKRDLVRLHGPAELADDLDEVEVIARESSLAMRDIVWLLERRQDSIGDFVQRMRDTAGRLISDLDYTLTCRSNRTALKMTLDAKRHLFLFYKEALHNILKHSKATEVGIRVFDSGDRLVMEIKDNGIGLPSGKDRPAAVRKLSDRARVLEGQFNVESSPGEGTLLRLAVKRGTLMAAKAST